MSRVVEWPWAQLPDLVKSRAKRLIRRRAERLDDGDAAELVKLRID